MSSPLHSPWRAGVSVPAFALALVALGAFLRIQRVEQVSAVADWPAASAGRAESGPVGRLPRMVVPGGNTESFEWMDQTRQMLSTGELRVRRVDYENAPVGHAVRSASPYRWWLGLLAWACHALSGLPLGPSLERAALFADPLLHGLLLAATAIFGGRWLGAAAGALCAAALACLYPLAAGFLPGAPSDQGLAIAAAIWSVLPLLAGIGGGGARRRWFFLGGVAGGLGLWFNVAGGVPVVAGIGAGALAAAGLARGEAGRDPALARDLLPWRSWALGGAVTCLGAYLVEFFPAHMGSWEMRAIHPVYGVAWLGLGELLAVSCSAIQLGRAGIRAADLGRLALGLAAVAAVPAAMRLTHTAGFLVVGLSGLRLTRLPDGAAASSLFSWIYRDGMGAVAWATFMPVVLVSPAVWLALRPRTGFAPRAAVALALGPVLVSLGFAFAQLSWWNGFDAALLPLLVAGAAALRGPDNPRLMRGALLGLVAGVLATGLFQAFPRVGFAGQTTLEDSEVVGLVERDLARWLAVHAPPAGDLILAPTNATMALYYYGGLRGLATLDWDNRDGVQAEVRIVSASTAPEAQELVNERGVTHIIIPSWDPQLDGFAKLGLGHVENSFIDQLHRWALIPWLRPIAYPIPVIQGFENQSVVIMEVTDEQNEAELMSRTTEYFVESGNLELAAAADTALRRFPADLGALVARAQVENARGDAEAFGQTVGQLLPRLSGEGERSLPWDRRVSLAVVLAQAKQVDRARAQTRRCLDDADDARLRSLPTGSLYHLLVLMKAFGMRIADPRLQELALDLLPPDLQARLGR